MPPVRLLLLLVPALLAAAALLARGQDRAPSGRAVYAREACWQCHTHAGDASFPALDGTRRTGPVIGGPGPARSREWHLAHFHVPRAVAAESAMPAYPRLFSPHPRAAALDEFLARYDSRDGSKDQDGIVTFQEYRRAGGTEWEAALRRFDTGNQVLSRADAAPVAKKELTALLDYLAAAEKPEETPPGYLIGPNGHAVEQRAQAIARGRRLFSRHCAGCHGERADGNGEAAPFFGDQPPRNFLRGEYRYQSSPAPAAPSDHDLYNTIRRGAGPSMPAWPQLAHGQVWDLVEFLKSNHPGYLPRELFVTKGGETLLAFVQKDAEVDDASGAKLGERRVRKIDGRWWLDDALITDGMQAGDYTFRLGRPVYAWMDDYAPEEIKLPDAPIPYTAASAALGAKVYEEFGCVDCHGPEGKGDGQAGGTTRGSLGQIMRPADYSRGARHLKAGADAASLVRIFLTGLHGTPMPSYARNFASARSAPPKEAPWHLAHYVMRQAGVPFER